jgi:hypothetical protein
MTGEVKLTEAMVEAGAAAQWNLHVGRARRKGLFRPSWDHLDERVRKLERADARACLEAALAAGRHALGKTEGGE